MKKGVAAAILLGTILSFLNAQESAKQDIQWEKIREAFRAYTESPSPDNAKRILSVLPKEFDYTTADFKQWSSTVDPLWPGEPWIVLENMVRKGDEFAIRVAFAVLVISDGAYTECLVDLLGESFSIDLTAFLEGAKVFVENTHKRNGMLEEILGSGFRVTSEAGLKKQMQLRIKSLEAITRPDLVNIRDTCLDILARWK